MKDYSNLSFTWNGDLTSVSGTAQQARNMLRPLIEGGAHVRLEHMPINRAQEPMNEWWNNTLNTCRQVSPGLIRINSVHPSQGKPNPTGGPTVLFTHWETNEPPKQWREKMFSDTYDEIWVPNSLLAKQLDGCNKKVRVLPYSLDENFLNGKTIADVHSVSEQSFVFGTTGTWDNRKNLSDTIIAYFGEFSSIDKVVLVIKTNGQNAIDVNERKKISNMVQAIKKSINRSDHPPIILVQDVFRQEAMDSLIRKFSCFVSSSRGDARNITMVKAMARGIPCIFTDCLASKDIVDRYAKETHTNPRFLQGVNYFIEPVMQMGNYYTGIDRWTKPSCDQLMFAMRNVYTDHFTDPGVQDRAIMAKESRKIFSKSVLPNLLEEAQPFAVQRLA